SAGACSWSRPESVPQGPRPATRSARSTWRKHSETAPTISSWGGRSARPRTRAPPHRRFRTRSLGVFQRLEQPPEMLVMGEEGAVEELGAVALHEEGGEVLHLPVADLGGVVLDVEPAEARAGKFLRQLEEALAVAFAAVAPQGAKAGDVQGRVHRCPILFTRSPE